MTDGLDLLAFGADGWGDELFDGLRLTILLALTTLPFGLALGFIIALAKNSSEPTLRAAANVYTTIFRGVPELLTLFIVYYGGQILLQQIVGLFTDAYVEISGFTAGVIALGLVFSAFASEVFLSAFRGIKAGQYEAGDALGLSRFKTMRLIILPQLIRLALPGLSNLWLILLKDTALVSVIALDDLLRKTNIAVGVTKEPFLFYSVACLIYLILSIISSVGLGGIDRWTQRGEAR
ncbi:MAG: ABC transporter permease [Pseudomonadota bacterium]